MRQGKLTVLLLTGVVIVGVIQAQAETPVVEPPTTPTVRENILATQLIKERKENKIVIRNFRARIGAYRNQYGSTSAQNRSLAKAISYQIGYSGQQWICADNIFRREASYVHTKYNNAGSGAYGIPQALPGTKMRSAGPDWKYNPATQIYWGFSYMKKRYGSPCGAWSFWKSHQSY